MTIHIYGVTDRGMIRQQNQDAFYQWTNGRTACALVCDGMGGAQSGNIASAMAAQHFVQVVAEQEGSPAQRIAQAVSEANEAVYRRARERQDCWGMGTTLVAALVSGDKAYIVNVGDSRCYHLTGERIRQVTRDHSFVAELVALGQLTEEQAREHPNRNIITRALGTESKVYGDLFVEQLTPGDRLLLCSDGLSNELTGEELWELAHDGAPEDCCKQLLRRTLERGAPDNVTVVVLAMDD